MSKTIKPIIPGTHRYADRKWGHCQSECCDPRPVLSKADAIADSAFVAVEVDLAEEFGLYTLTEALEMDREFDYNGIERMAEWELCLLEAPEAAVWTTSTREQRMLAEPIGDSFVTADENDDDVAASYAGAWLEGDLDDAFPTGGYVIEGGQRDRTSGKASGYVRVYELARDLDVPTGDLIGMLRNIGEYVAGPLAYVANPVADDCRSEWAAPLFYDMPRRKPAKHDPHAWSLTDPALAALRKSLLG